LFERGVARLEQRSPQILCTTREKIHITYDVRKTDSLIEPIVGILTIVTDYDSDDLRFVFRDNVWVISSYVTFFLGQPVIENPNNRPWKLAQACFVSDEAAEAAVVELPCGARANQQAKPADEAPVAAVPASPSLSPATKTVAPSQVEKEPQPPPGYITLNRDVEIGDGTNKFVIPKGSQLLVVSRTKRVLGVRFQGRLEIIPKSAATEPK
jgi:hypothetical protein